MSSKSLSAFIPLQLNKFSFIRKTKSGYLQLLELLFSCRLGAAGWREAADMKHCSCSGEDLSVTEQTQPLLKFPDQLAGIVHLL